MKYFSVPADFKNETIDKYSNLHDKYADSKIIETYGNVTIDNKFGSGRVISQQPKVSLKTLEKYVDYSTKKGIGFNYTLNASFMNNEEFTEEGLTELLRFLRMLYELGIKSITVSMPSLITLLNEIKYKFKIKASTICNIDSANKASAFNNLNIERLVIPESLHRNFPRMKSIVNTFNGDVEVIINSICHTRCAFRQFHYNETTSNSKSRCITTGVDYFEHRCLMQRFSSVGEIMKLGWIRPEDLKHYANIGITHFKIQGRQHVYKGNHIEAIEYYFKEDYDGNLMALLDLFNDRYSFKINIDNKKLDNYIDVFIKKTNFCKGDCVSCKYCDSWAKKSINMTDAQKVMDMANEFYQKCDMYNNIIAEGLKDLDQSTNKKKNENIQFNL